VLRTHVGSDLPDQRSDRSKSVARASVVANNRTIIFNFRTRVAHRAERRPGQCRGLLACHVLLNNLALKRKRNLLL
jgi:hypothetical protein